LNIMNIAMMEEINDALDSFKEIHNLKTLVFDHVGKAFSAGVEISEHEAITVRKMLSEFHDIFLRLMGFKSPTVACVRGAALGGGSELALFCDFVLASDKAKFGQPEIKVGVFPPIATLLLPKMTTMKKAVELLLLGETISADEAHKYGLINAVIPSATFDQEFDKFLAKISQLSATVLQHAKKVIKLGLGDDFIPKLKRIEEIYLNELMKTEDANEGIRAFMEKRSPVWRDG